MGSSEEWGGARGEGGDLSAVAGGDDGTSGSFFTHDARFVFFSSSLSLPLPSSLTLSHSSLDDYVHYVAQNLLSRLLTRARDARIKPQVKLLPGPYAGSGVFLSVGDLGKNRRDLALERERRRRAYTHFLPATSPRRGEKPVLEIQNEVLCFAGDQLTLSVAKVMVKSRHGRKITGLKKKVFPWRETFDKNNIFVYIDSYTFKNTCDTSDTSKGKCRTSQELIVKTAGIA